MLGHLLCFLTRAAFSLLLLVMHFHLTTCLCVALTNGEHYRSPSSFLSVFHRSLYTDDDGLDDCKKMQQHSLLSTAVKQKCASQKGNIKIVVLSSDSIAAFCFPHTRRTLVDCQIKSAAMIQLRIQELFSFGQFFTTKCSLNEPLP